MGGQDGARSSGLELLKIIQDALNDDRVAFDKLKVWIRRRQACVWVRNKKSAVVNVSVRNEEDQKELCGDVLLEIAKRFRDRAPCTPDKTDAFVARIVTNKAVDFYRRRATAKRRGEDLVGEIPEQEPQLPTMDEETRRAIRVFVAALPECERRASEGYMLGESAEQTAARTGIRLGTLKDCRVRVRKLIQEKFGR